MPGINPPNDEHLVYMLADMRNQIRALATNQQAIISNLQGQPILALGLQPGSNPAEYGLGLLSQAFGSNLAFFGEDASGNVGLKYFDTTGSLVRLDNAAGTTWYNTAGYVIRQDGPSGTFWYDGTTADPTSANVTMSVTPANGFEVFNAGTLVTKTDSAGLHVYDGSAQRVAAGHLANGDYGLQVTDTSGNSEEILPLVADFVAATIAVSSTSYTTDGGPSVTAVVGASGSVRVDVSSQVESNTAMDGAYVGLFIDGNPWDGNTGDLLECFSAGGQTLATNAASVQISGLTPGSHTFELQYKHSTGTNDADFWNRSLLVTPI